MTWQLWEQTQLLTHTCSQGGQLVHTSFLLIVFVHTYSHAWQVGCPVLSGLQRRSTLTPMVKWMTDLQIPGEPPAEQQLQVWVQQCWSPHYSIPHGPVGLMPRLVQEALHPDSHYLTGCLKIQDTLSCKQTGSRTWTPPHLYRSGAWVRF